MKIRQDSYLLLIFTLFQYISSKIFTNQALWKHFNDWILYLFILWMFTEFLIDWGKNQTHGYASICLEDSFGSFVGGDHTVLVENNLAICVQCPTVQHWLSIELSTVHHLHYSLYISISTMRHKMQVKKMSWFWEYISKAGTEDLGR